MQAWLPTVEPTDTLVGVLAKARSTGAGAIIQLSVFRNTSRGNQEHSIWLSLLCMLGPSVTWWGGEEEKKATYLILQLTFLLLFQHNQLRKRVTETFATRMMPARFWKQLHDTYPREAWSALCWNRGKVNAAPRFWSLWIVLFAQLHLLQTKEHYVSPKPDLHCCSSACFQPSRTAIMTAALDPVGFSLSGTISPFSFSTGRTLLCEADEGLLLGTEMATGRQKL